MAPETPASHQSRLTRPRSAPSPCSEVSPAGYVFFAMSYDAERGATRRRAKLAMPYPAEATAAVAMPMMLVVTQVRQALQQTAAIGAFSPYFPAACAIRPVQIVFTGKA